MFLLSVSEGGYALKGALGGVGVVGRGVERVMGENYQLLCAYYPLNECDMVEMRLVELKGRVFWVV